MAIRVAIRTDPLDERQVALGNALLECSDFVELQVLIPHVQWIKSRIGEASSSKAADDAGMPSSFRQVYERRSNQKWDSVLALFGRLPFGTMFQLIVLRPDIIICEDFGDLTAHAFVYRLLRRRSRLLLCATEPPRQNGLRERFVVGVADGILVNGEAVAQAVKKLSVPVSRIFPIATPYNLDAFLPSVATRSGPEAYRIVYSGDLSPQSGAADLLASLAACAELHPSRLFEIWWAGEGDLAGVLSAQPLPQNVSQSFIGSLDPLGMPLIFGQSGLLVVPSLTDDLRTPVAEGLAAGLPVIGSKRNRLVRQLVQDEVNGWLYDPLQPGDISHALSRALGSSIEQLDSMRDQGQAIVRPSTTSSLGQRIRRAITAVLPELSLEPTLPQLQ